MGERGGWAPKSAVPHVTARRAGVRLALVAAHRRRRRRRRRSFPRPFHNVSIHCPRGNCRAPEYAQEVFGAKPPLIVQANDIVTTCTTKCGHAGRIDIHRRRVNEQRIPLCRYAHSRRELARMGRAVTALGPVCIWSWWRYQPRAGTRRIRGLPARCDTETDHHPHLSAKRVRGVRAFIFHTTLPQLTVPQQESLVSYDNDLPCRPRARVQQQRERCRRRSR